METLFSGFERPLPEVTKLEYIRKTQLTLYNVQLTLTTVNSVKKLVAFCHN